MDRKTVFTGVPVSSRIINQATTSSNLQTTSQTKSDNYKEYKVRVPKNLSKKYYMMRFNTPAKMDLSAISKAQMGRVTTALGDKEEDDTPKFGAGSEFGRERREEARKRRRGYMPKPKDPESAPWQLKIGGKGGRRYSGRKEAGINENSAYYILTQTPDGTFEAVPVHSWYNFTQDINYRTLTADDAEEEFAKRDKTMNYFSLMIKKRLENKEEGDEAEATEMKNKKTTSTTSTMRIHDDDLELSSDEDDDDDEEDDDGTNAKSETAKKHQKKGNTKQKQKSKKGSDDESDIASSEEDGYFDSKEVDYMSDSSSSEEEVEDTSKPTAKDDLNAEETSSESEDEDLNKVGKELRKIMKREEGDDSSEEDEEEDPDSDDMKGTSALFLPGKKKGKKNKASRSGSVSSTTTSSRSSTPTRGVNQDSVATSTVAAAAKKLSEERPGTPSKSRKRPASQLAVPGKSEGGSPAAKKPRSSPVPSSASTPGTPVPSGEESHGITEDAVRRYLTRKPMTTKDLLQKFKTKRTGLTNEQTVQLIATILRKIKPEQTTIKNTMYLSLRS